MGHAGPDVGFIKLIFCLVFDLFRSRATLEAEILVLRQQIIVLRRGRVGRLPLSASDRLVLGWVCGLFPNTCDALAIIRPETVMRWHRAGFRSYWRWKSRRRPGRPAVHPLHKKFARLTRMEEAKGLYEDTRQIGTREGWDKVLESKGVRLRGHRLLSGAMNAKMKTIV